MAITGMGNLYNSSAYGSSYAAKGREAEKTSETSKTDTEIKARSTASDELSYLSEKYECLKSPDYSVKINHSLLAKAVSDNKTSEWLEYNLSLIPQVVENLKSSAASRGAKVISCDISIDGYDSMTTEIVTQVEADPGTEKAREELKEKIKERREEKKADEKRAEKRAEKEKVAERRAKEKTAGKTGNETGKYTVKVTGTDIKAVAEKVIDMSLGTSAFIGAGLDIKA